MSSSGLTWIVFDVGGVLVNDTVRQKLGDLAAKYRIDPDRLDRERGELRPHVDLGLVAESAFWYEILSACGVSPEPSDADLADYITVDEEVLDLVRQCRNRGMKTAIISNDSAELSGLRRKHFGADSLFDVVVISAELGVKKPDPDIFREALDRFHAEPCECLFIDDAPENIEAASRAGMHTHRFVDADRLRRHLDL